MVYEMADDVKRVLCDAKVDSQFARAMRYVENVGARAVVPSAGPPCFLDPDLFGLNMIDGDELSIFPDQTAFLERLDRAGHRGVLNMPGTCIEVTPDSLEIIHPVPARRSAGDLRRQASVPRPLPGGLDAVARRAEGGAGIRRRPT